MGLDVSGSGQMEPQEPPTLGALVESTPLRACPQGRFILTCDKVGVGLSPESRARFLAVADNWR